MRLSASIIIILLTCLAYKPASAQSGETGTFLNCGTDEHHRFLLSTDDAYRRSYTKQKTEVDSIIRETRSKRMARQEITIPVVVHIIHLGEPIGTGSNISDAQIFSAIQGLNDRFSNAIGSGQNTGISFCLATTDPNGNPTTGINRVNGSVIPKYASEGITYSGSCGASEHGIKDLSRWPTLEYYNIWAVHKICGDNPNGGGVGGYAYYPNGGPYDGCVVYASGMIYGWNGVAHELGHGLNLAHTFDGDGGGTICPPNSNCLTQGDFICDTPPHKSGDCGPSNPCTNAGDWDNSRYNYMSYCNTPSSLERFTPDQIDRMQATMQVWPRSELLNSAGCGTAGGCNFPTELISGFDATGMSTVKKAGNNGSGNYYNVWQTIEGANTCEYHSCGSEKIYEVTIPDFSGADGYLEVVASAANNISIVVYENSCFNMPVHIVQDYGVAGSQFPVSPNSTIYVVIDLCGSNNDFDITFNLDIRNYSSQSCNLDRTGLVCGNTLTNQQLVFSSSPNELIYQGSVNTNWTCGNPGVISAFPYYTLEKKYYFIAPVEGEYTFNVHNTNNNPNFNPDLFIMNDCYDNTGGNFYEFAGTNSAGSDESVTVYLFAGQTYYINVDGLGDEGAGVFDISVSCACAFDATALNYSSIPYVIKGYGSSVIGTSSNFDEHDFGNGCVESGMAGPEKIYKVTIPSVFGNKKYGVQISAIQKGSDKPFRIIAYEDKCDLAIAMSFGYINDEGGVYTKAQGLNLYNDLLSDKTYYVVIEGNADDYYYLRFDDLVQEDVPCNVPAIGCDDMVSGSITEADHGGKVVYYGSSYANCTPYNDDDFVFHPFYPSQAKVYRFSPESSGYYTITLTGTTENFDPDLFELESCHSNVSVRRSANRLSSQETISNYYLSGVTYYFAVDPFYVDQGYYDLQPFGSYTLSVQCCSLSGVETSSQGTTCDLDNGSASSAPVGGIPPFQYSWSNGGNTQSIDNLPAGTYSVTVTSFDGCVATSFVEVASSSGISAGADIIHTTCGLDNGSVTIDPAGGNGYTYQWANGADTQTLNNLSPGTYSVTVTTSDGCDTSLNIVINSSAGLSLVASATDETCDGCNDGSATVDVSGGTGYTYEWSNGGTDPTQDDLAPGTYEVTVTSAEGCSHTTSVTINPFGCPPIGTDIISTGPLCYGDCNGSAAIIVDGGVRPYTYLWSNGSLTDTANDLCAGGHSVTVQDANGCQAVSTFTLASNEPVNVTLTAMQDTLKANVTGGVPPYTYLWSNGTAGDHIIPGANGTYTVTVKDANGCTVEKTGDFTINSRPGIRSGGIKIMPNPARDICTIEGIDEVSIKSIDIINTWGVHVKRITGADHRVYTGDLIPGLYVVMVKDSKERIYKEKLVVIR